MDANEKMLRNGCTRIAKWFYEESKRMAEEGKNGKEITERLWDLRQILIDWRSSSTFPDNVIPWVYEERKNEVIEKYITEQKPKWLQVRAR
jgi:hypothetical protein